VQIEWLRERRPQLRGAPRRALARIVGELEARKARAYAGVLEGIPEGFEQVRARLLPRLESYRAWIRLDDSGPSPTFAQVSGQLLHTHAGRLAELLDRVHGPEDREEAHQARIQAKRLRYLLEPLTPHVEDGKQALRQLKLLQDLLGELNDLALLERTVAAAFEQSALDRAHGLLAAGRAADAEQVRRVRRETLEGGYLALVKLIEARKRALFADLAAKWLGEASASHWTELGAIAERLSASATERTEIERKYLLREVPEHARAGECREIVQGWLPGGAVRERLRRIRSPGGERFLRTVKLGAGLRRTEFEEEITPELFARLWPLTAGCRISKRRYVVPCGDLVWEIDEFEEPELVLAEVELPSETTEVALPDWLSPHVEREVTGEPEYYNRNLAR
jgi:CYTH domain-containing protein